MRCAAYARYSTDRQNPLSIADQLRKCQEFAARSGWEFLETCVFTDEAAPGTTDARSGLRRMLDAACSSQRPFDVVLVDDTSRLSRRLADSLRISEQLSYAGVRLVFVSQGIVMLRNERYRGSVVWNRCVAGSPAALSRRSEQFPHRLAKRTL